MRALIALTLIAACCGIASAQTDAAKPARPATKHKQSESRTEIKSTAKQMAAGIEAADKALTPLELDIAQRVQVGRVPCELGAFVTVTADPRVPGYFILETKTAKYRLSPVESRTGVVRLEDPNNGVMWMQLANKSMLLNQKLGQRLADECMTATQSEYAQYLMKNPAPSLLEPPKAVASQAQVTVVVPPAATPTAVVAPAATPVATPAVAPASAASAAQ